jgi:hypothetical protein
MCNCVVRYTLHGISALILVSMFSASIDAKAADTPPATEGAKVAWPDGSARYDFVMD